MRSTRYSTSRQKACQQCAGAKAKCDRKAGACSRCQQRGTACVYLQSQAFPIPEPDVTGLADGAEREVPRGPALSTNTTEDADARPRRIPARSEAHQAPELDFSCLELACPINADDIANRWLNSFVPLPGQKTKDYTPSVSAFIHRILQSYANSSLRGHKVPPFIHWSQLVLQSSKPLSTCLFVIRVCDKPPAGGTEASVIVLQQEMTSLFDQYSTEDDMALLATYQAHLIYSMIIFFRFGREQYSFLRPAMMNTQELACAAARSGLVCAAEKERARPTWESWIAAEAKRRTLFTMCLFDSALLTHDGLPTHLATELRGLPAPASKSLWDSRDRHDWQSKYDLHLEMWPEGGLRIDELWPMPEGCEENEITKRRSRVDVWLEDLDEFGTMIYAVTSATHGT